jgi:tRNA pseudouridine38-40 synthase
MIDTHLKTTRIALVIQYIGANFHGWQRQPNHRSVQGDIEDAISSIMKKKVVVHGAGRTDSGVHAAAQVAHFELVNSPIPPDHWAKVLNSYLADDVLIRASAQVNNDWHACFSALWRRYRYTIYTGKIPNLFLQPFSWHYYHQPLNRSLIQEALNYLLGVHDFSAFRRAGSLRSHSRLEMQEVVCTHYQDLLHIEIQASGFLYGMVRLLVGMLVEVGAGKKSVSEFRDIWLNRRRDLVKYSAPAKGLCLLRIGYPEFPIPESVWFNSQPIFTFN